MFGVQHTEHASDGQCDFVLLGCQKKMQCNMQTRLPQYTYSTEATQGMVFQLKYCKPGTWAPGQVAQTNTGLQEVNQQCH